MDGIFGRKVTYPAVVFVIVLGIVFSTLLAGLFLRWERDRADAALARLATAVTTSVTACLQHQVTNVQLLAAAQYAMPDQFGRSEFASFARPLVNQCAEIVALGWIPRVPGEERRQFEARAGQQHTRFVIGEQNSAGRFVAAEDRKEYFPLLFMEPQLAFWSTLGFDVASNPRHRAALEEAWRTGSVAFSEHSKSASGDSVLEIMFYPVYVQDAAASAVWPQKEDLKGFVTGVSSLSGIVEEALQKAGNPPVRVVVSKLTRMLEWQSVYRAGPPGADHAGGQRRFQTTAEIGGDRWKLSFLPAPGTYPASPGLLPYGVLGGGLAFTFIAAGYLHSSKRHTEHSENLVVELQREVAVRRLAEERFRTALKAAPVAVFNQDRELRYTWVQNLPRLIPDAFIGETDQEGLEDREASERLTALKRRVLESGEAVREQLEVRLGGELRHCDVTLEPLFADGPTPTGLTGAIVDITDHIALQARLQQQTAQLAEADRRKDEFLALLAHELRNPLAPIGNAVQVLKRQKPPLAATVQWAVAIIERQLRHLRRLIDELLDVSRITLGKIRLSRAPVALGDVLAAALETAQPVLSERHHAVTFEVPEEPLMVNGDSVRLVQVFANLLDNAAKYTPAGGRIALTAAGEDRSAVVRVRDNGIGLPPDALPRLFETFVQIENPAAEADMGLGLGLSLSRSLVEMHGGRIDAASAGPGKGSEFTVRLPLCSAEVAPSAATDGPSPAGAAVRILVVEDQPDVAASFSLLLEAMGHTVETFNDGRTALDKARAFRPEVAFVDIRMPGMDGYEVAGRLRREFGMNIALVAVTGFGQEEDRRRTAEAGFDQHLLKPVDIERLETVLRAAQVRRADRASDAQ